MIHETVLFLAFIVGQSPDNLKPIPGLSAPDTSLHEGILAPDECGDPKMVSSGYGSAQGRILKVLSPTVLEVRLDDGRRQQVYLACVTAVSLRRADRKRAIRELQHLVVGKRFNAATSSAIGASDARSFTARVIAGNEEVNVFLLKRGLLRYEQNPQHVDWWTACHYERAEAAAKEGGLGIWRSVVTPRSN